MKGNIKIGIATILVLLMAMGVTSAQTTYDQANNQITGKKTYVNTTDYFNVTFTGTALEFQVGSNNRTATTFNVDNETGLQTNVTGTLSDNDWFWVNSSSTGTYWVNVSNADNSSEYVNFTVGFINESGSEFVFVKLGNYVADGKLDNMRVEVRDIEYGTLMDWNKQVNLTFNTSHAWINNGTTANDTFRQSAIVSVNNGKGGFSVGAFNDNNEVVANLTGTPVTGNVSTNSTVITFEAPPNKGYIYGSYYTTNTAPDYVEKGKINESKVTGGVDLKVQTDYGITVYEFTDIGLNSGGYTEYHLTVPLGNYSVNGSVTEHNAVSRDVYVAKSGASYSASLTFEYAGVPTYVNISYDGENKVDRATNLANGKESNAEQLIITVKDQFHRLIADNVQVQIENPGDLNKDGQITTSDVVACNDGTGSIWVTALNATKENLTGPIQTVSITATSLTNQSATDMANKTYLIKGNTSISGQVWKVDEKANYQWNLANNGTVWAAYANMSNHSYEYVANNFPWMVSSIKDGSYILDGIAVPQNKGFIDVIVYAKSQGYNGVNDTIGAPTLAAQGELDSSVSRSGRTDDFIAAADYQALYWYQDGDTENHDLKLNDRPPWDYRINLTEATHYLTFGSSTEIHIKLRGWQEGSPEEKYNLQDRQVKVNLTGLNDTKLEKDGVKSREIWVTTDSNGEATLNFTAGNTQGNATVTAYYDTGTDDQGVISDSGVKHVIKTGTISFDVTNMQGTQVRKYVRDGRVVAVLWYDDGDGAFEPGEDSIVATNTNEFASVNKYTAQLDKVPSWNTSEIVEAEHGSLATKLNINNPFNIQVKPHNARYVSSDAHSSFANVVPADNKYHVEALVVDPLATSLNESVIAHGHSTVMMVGAGTQTADVYVDVSGLSSPSPAGGGPTTAKELKQDILQDITEYINHPSKQLKNQILQEITQYMGMI